MTIQPNLRHPQDLFVQPVRYEIPPFQRRYVWERDGQWEPLWNDIQDLAQSILDDDDAKPRFMGAVVLQQSANPTGTLPRRIVVDGQQRLTTLQILIDAAQEVLENRGHALPAERLAALVLNGEAFRDGDPDAAFKVWPTLVDREAFRHAMSNELSAAGHSDSGIAHAHKFFGDMAGQWLDRSPAGEARAAAALENALRTRLALVAIDLGAEDDPHVIFETLNARGTPLLQSDMVRNRILHDAGLSEGDGQARIAALWPFEGDGWWSREVGRGFQRRPRIDIYLNHWLTLRNGTETGAHDEFREFGTYARGREEAGETIEDVARDMGAVGALFRDIEDEQRKDVASFLELRRVMNAGVVTPLLLRLLSGDIPPHARDNCLAALESFLVRRLICGYSARGYGTLFTRLVGLLAGERTETVDRVLIDYLADRRDWTALWPDDREMLENFLTQPLYQWMTRRRLLLILARIETHVRTVQAETVAMPDKLQIEHIMPQGWRTHWPLVSDDESAEDYREDVIHTIGNLTLVSGALNKTLSNAPWETKRGGLAEHSVLFLNKRLVHEGPGIWDEAAIENRARWLHARAVEVWPHHRAIGRTG